MSRFGDRFPLVIFDVDGVLLDGRSVHLSAFNRALRDVGVAEVTEAYHDEVLDSLSTMDKIRVMWEQGLFPKPTMSKTVDLLKKGYTEDAFDRLQANPRLLRLFTWLRDQGSVIAVASNARQTSVDMVLIRLGIRHLVATVATPTDGACRPKPTTDLYERCMANEDVRPPSQTLILEDSPVGLKGARATGATVLPVFHHEDVSVRLLRRFWQEGKTGTTVLIPMAGEGKRFRDAGHTLPKPFVDVEGRPMIQRVVESLGMPEAHRVFLVRTEHQDLFMARDCVGKCYAAEVPALTQGAACTTLLAETLIDPEDRLVVANSDQLLEWDADRFLQRMSLANADAGIVTFRAPDRDPKWSYVLTNGTDLVSHVYEKRAVSERATCGVYFWRRARDYFESVRDMMDDDDRTNGEFYVAPSFNYLIEQGKKVLAHDVKKMRGLGTPDDLTTYLNRDATAKVEGPQE